MESFWAKLSGREWLPICLAALLSLALLVGSGLFFWNKQQEEHRDWIERAREANLLVARDIEQIVLSIQQVINSLTSDVQERVAEPGADAVAISNSALQAIGCLGMRACHTNNCPVGIATQKPELVSRLVVEKSARQLHNFLEASVDLMKVMARACGHTHLNEFSSDDLSTWKYDMHRLSGVAFAGVGAG